MLNWHRYFGVDWVEGRKFTKAQKETRQYMDNTSGKYKLFFVESTDIDRERNGAYTRKIVS